MGAADITTVNPATGETIATYRVADATQVAAALDAAGQAYPRWRDTALRERAVMLRALAEVLEDARRELSASLTAEMGKPRAQATSEVDKCVAAVRWVADEGPAVLEPRQREDPAGSAAIRCEPIGAVLAVMPWNFPYWQSLRFALPTLVAGNVAMIKPAPSTSGSALLLQRVIDRAGLPPGVLQTVLWDNASVEQAIGSDVVAGVSLTGSEAAGRAVAATAGRHLKRMVLELGGSDPFLVFADADVEVAAETAAASRFQNAGQSCIAAKRFIVHADIAERFGQALVRHARAVIVGDPMAEDVTMGPLSSVAARDRVHDQVRRAVAGGARVLVGGKPIEGAGAFFEPTVLIGVRSGSPTAVEEVFGPVASVMVAADDAELVDLANDTDFGLGATVFTADLDRGRRVAARLEAGQVFVNSMVRSEPQFPFGGVKRSGFGRELGPEGFAEFVNTKLVRIAG